MSNFKMQVWEKATVTIKEVVVKNVDGKEYKADISYTPAWIVTEDTTELEKEKAFKDNIQKSITWITNLSKYEVVENVAKKQDVKVEEPEEIPFGTHTEEKKETNDLFDLSPKNTPEASTPDDDDDFDDLF